LLIRAADAAAAAQSQADADAAAAAQAAVDYAARAAASAYDAQVAADAATQAALLAGDGDDDDDDSDDNDGYGSSIFNDYSLLSGSTAASNQSSANGFLAGSNPNSFQVPLTASEVANLFGSGSGSLISSPVDLGSGPGGDPATSAIAPNNPATTHTVTVQSYIGASSTGPFLGDGRGPSASPSDAYRTSSTIAVDPMNPSSSGSVTSSTGNTVAFVPGPNGPIVLLTGHASSSGLTGTSTYVSPGIVRVNLNGSAANSLVPGAPPITYNTSVSINFNNGTYAGSVTRTDFPSFQIFVDGRPIYNSTEVGTPTNLYNTTFVPIKGTLPDPNH
jgi:hypothetical protein